MEEPVPGGGGGQPLDHYPYGGERMVSAEQTPRKGVIWSRMTASAVAIGARLKGCARTEPTGAGLRVQGSSVLIWPLLLSDTAAELAVTWCAAGLLMANTKWVTAGLGPNDRLAGSVRLLGALIKSVGAGDAAIQF